MQSLRTSASRRRVCCRFDQDRDLSLQDWKRLRTLKHEFGSTFCPQFSLGHTPDFHPLVCQAHDKLFSRKVSSLQLFAREKTFKKEVADKLINAEMVYPILMTTLASLSLISSKPGKAQF